MAGQRQFDTLTASRLVITKQLPWQADTLRVNNPTDQSVYIRYGGQDVPTATNYDDLVPPFSERSIAVHTAWFVLALAAIPQASITGGSTTANRVIITFSRNDPPTNSNSYQQLGLIAADLQTSATASSGIVGPFDLSSWGGLIVNGAPVVNNWDQQGWVAYEISSDKVSWGALVRLPLWPGFQLMAQLPRIARYGRLRWQAYGGAWSSAATFTVVGRPTLVEVLSVAPVLSGSWPLWAWQTGTTYAFPGDLVEAVNLSADNTAAVGNNARLDVFSVLDATGPAYRQLGPQLLQAGASLAPQVTMADPLPINFLQFVATAGVPVGRWSAVPRLLPAISNILGTASDAVGTLTLEGQLRQIVANSSSSGVLDTDLALIAAHTIPRAGGTGQTIITAVGAGVWTRTAIQLVAGQLIYAVNGGHSVANTQTQFGVGDAAGVFQAVAQGYGNWNINMGHNTGIAIVAPATWLWVWAAAAGNVANTVWYV